MANCVICGKELTGKQRKYCSHNCREKQYYRTHKEKINARNRKKYHEHKDQSIKKCVICGKELTGRQEKYCSKKCRGRGYYLEHRDDTKYHMMNASRERVMLRHCENIDRIIGPPTCRDCLYYNKCGGRKKSCDLRDLSVEMWGSR